MINHHLRGGMILKTNGFRGVQFGGCPFIFRETLLLAVEAKPKAKLSLMRRIVSSVGLISHPWPRHISWKAPPQKIRNHIRNGHFSWSRNKHEKLTSLSKEPKGNPNVFDDFDVLQILLFSGCWRSPGHTALSPVIFTSDLAWAERKLCHVTLEEVTQQQS